MQLKRLDYRKFNNPVWAFAPLGVVMSLLVLVYFIGYKHRWLQLGAASLQPSEFAKPASIIFLAYFLSLRLRAINDKHTLRPALLALGTVAALVAGPDLGTAIMLVLTAAILFYVAGLERRYIVGAGLAGILLLIVFIAVKPYRLARVIARVDPDIKSSRRSIRAGISARMSKGPRERPIPRISRSSRESRLDRGACSV